MRSSMRPVGYLLAGASIFALVLACQKRAENIPQGSTGTATPALSYTERGQQAYLSNCAMCHGPWGEGDGPLASQLAKEGGVAPAQLNDPRLADLGRAQIIRIITNGGGKTHRSNLMPPWGARLPDDVIADVADYVLALPTLKPGIPRATIQKYLEAPAGVPEQGRQLFVYTCTACHGPYGQGDGPMAEALWQRNHVRPRNLTDSVYFAPKTDKELFETVSLGGPYTGHSTMMPAWSVRFSPAQIKDLVAYVRVLSRTAARP